MKHFQKLILSQILIIAIIFAGRAQVTVDGRKIVVFLK